MVLSFRLVAVAPLFNGSAARWGGKRLVVTDQHHRPGQRHHRGLLVRSVTIQ